MQSINMALVGNPNAGKSSLFNKLTGLHQKVANFPGVTVDKKVGAFSLSRDHMVELVDLPGTYSLFASSPEEQVVTQTLLDEKVKSDLDLIIFVADVLHLKRSLFLLSQLKDLGYPVLLILTMSDLMKRYGVSLELEKLRTNLGVPTFLFSAQSDQQVSRLKAWILANHLEMDRFSYADQRDTSPKNSFDVSRIHPDYFMSLGDKNPNKLLYPLWLRAATGIEEGLHSNESFDFQRMRRKEITLRYDAIDRTLQGVYRIDSLKAHSIQGRIDRTLTHPFYGLLFFFGVLLLVFTAIYSWSAYPMELIDMSFATVSQWVIDTFPSGMLTDLFANGVLPGLGGVMVFVPQIALLFLFMGILEQSGFMSRLIFLSDDLLRPFGLSGRSVIPLMSGVACAIPAIMSARVIKSWKERLILILTLPFITCSARLPVYLIIIALVIPNTSLYGIQLQGLVLMAMYLFGFIIALCSSWLLHRFLKIKAEPGDSMILEMPSYRVPLPRNLIYTVVLKVKDFALNAGKIIFAISMVLWFLSSHGASEDFNQADQIVRARFSDTAISQEVLDRQVASYQLKNSYIGTLGRWIEPSVMPLGYDWKMGIALISSFAAREVFVGTLATIYRVGGEDEKALLESMRNDRNEQTDEKTFNLATGVSLLIFYALAMQCMSTVAIVRRELRSWKWAIFQLIGMNAFAYFGAFFTYQIFS